MTLVLPNPWSRERWNITAQGQFLRDHGMALATVYSHAVGVEIGATKPAAEQPKTVEKHTTRIVTKNYFVSRGGDGAGSSGDGAPS